MVLPASSSSGTPPVSAVTTAATIPPSAPPTSSSSPEMVMLIAQVAALSAQMGSFDARLSRLADDRPPPDPFPPPGSSGPLHTGFQSSAASLSHPPGFQPFFSALSPATTTMLPPPASMSPSLAMSASPTTYSPDSFGLFHRTASPVITSGSFFLDRTSAPRIQTIDPSSCWGPLGSRASGGYTNTDTTTPRVRVDPPRFDGTDASNWTRNIHYYFDHLGTPHDKRLHFVLPLFDPPAADWIWNYCESHTAISWMEFLDDVRRRFDATYYQNHTGLLSKLTQTGSVEDYQSAFEALQSKVKGLHESALLDIFIAGLKQPLQGELVLHQPPSLAAAFALAKHLAACRPDLGSSSYSAPRKQWSAAPSRATLLPPAAQPVAAAPQSGSARPPAGNSRPLNLSKLPIVRVSAAEKAERSRKGLCWFCDEQWSREHVCKQKFLAYMGDDEEDVELDDTTDPPTPADPVISADLSHLRSMHGPPKSKALWLDGSIHDAAVHLLVDTGSSQDFLHPRVAERLQLHLTQIPPFRVYVGNGQYLLCSHVCRRTPLSLQGTEFCVDLHVLQIHGPDVILGMPWLESLGKVTHDYVAKTMTFSHDGRAVELRGVSRPPMPISASSLAIHLSHDTFLELFEIYPADPPPAHSADAQDIVFPESIPPGIRATLQRHSGVFALPQGLPPSRAFDHRIHLAPHTKPINVRPYRYPYFQKNEIEKQVREMLDQGVIQPSTSPFSSPVLLVRKKDGTHRFCIDYRALNKATVPDHFPIPTADELFDELGSARFFTKLDLNSGYHQIRMHAADAYKTAFRTHDGHFEFLVMPFGLTNGPSTFQAAMNSIFRPLLRQFVIVFFDDILVYSPTLESHADHLHQVLSTLEHNNFFIKFSKCTFCSPTVEYLGHILSAGSLQADPSKIEAMLAWPTPTSARQLRGFLGLTGYYRRFIAHYAQIAAPLTDLLRKDSFQWSATATSSFESLKTAMTTAPVLRLPDFELTFYIETDASDFGIGAVLIQENQPLAFFSRKLGPRRRSASTYHKELYAIVEAVQKWRQYLLGREFVIRTDQRSLKELLQQVIQTPEQQLYVRKLMGYKFRIEYKTGTSNRAADALSRRDEDIPDAAVLLEAIAHPIPDVIELLRKETASKEDLLAMTETVQRGTMEPEWRLIDGLLYKGSRIVVSEQSVYKEVLLYEYHNTPMAGHPGFDRTFRRLATVFYWPRMRRDVQRYVAACVECQTTKYCTQKPAGLLQPLPIPSQVWDDVSMDFITSLPLSKGFSTIMVVVDRLSKYAHFAALPPRFDAMRVARLFIDTVVRHHGFPRTLVSDRDPIFLSEVWREMLRLSGTKLHYSTAYHPQSDGQTEVRNRGLEQYLRAFTSEQPSKWANYLSWAELALNCFHHEGLGTSPFRALYGRDPPSLLAVRPSATTPPDVTQLITQRGELLGELRRHLEKAQQKMRDSANRHRRDVEFAVGDKVLLKLQHYRQHSVARPLSAKLSRRYYGPFLITERVGPVAYRLQLPDSARIHNVFHVSLLKKFVAGQSSTPTGELPAEFVSGRGIMTPVRILDTRLSLKHGQPVEQVLVDWSGDGSIPPSWEPRQGIIDRFPHLLADKEVFERGGVDTEEDNAAASQGEQGDNSVSGEVRDAPSTRPRRTIVRPSRFRDFV